MRKAKVIKGEYIGQTILIEGTDKDIWGKGWADMGGNPAAVKYMIRTMNEQIPDYGIVYYGKGTDNSGNLFHESELQFIEENQTKHKVLSTGDPSTLRNWHKLCVATFGSDSAPTKFIATKMKEQGEDQEVIADEGQLLYALTIMSEQDVK